MKTLIISLCLFSGLIVSNSALANANKWLSASQFYTTNSLTNLAYLKQNSPEDIVINYFNAAANLNAHNPDLALKLVNKYAADNYFSIDLMHQLLTYFFTNQSWQQYVNVYELLPDTQASLNETCGYDTATFALAMEVDAKSNYKWLLANKMPLWCVSLIASKLNNASLDKQYLHPFLLNLVSNEQLAQFNQLATTFNYGKINFSSTIPASKLHNSYQIVYRISKLAEKDPEQAYNELANSGLDSFTKQYLYNQIAAALATRQLFSLAEKALEQGNTVYLSDDEYEWRTRVYLATNNWQEVLDTIDSMPATIRNRSSWLYWQAFAYSNLGNKSKAKALLATIYPDYDYYSLLAQEELNTNLKVQAIPPAGKLSSIQYVNGATLSFQLYSLGKRYNNGNLVRLATRNLHYIINKSNDRDISIISKTAFDRGWYEMSIYSANKTKVKYASLSFPILYAEQYSRYAKSNAISMSYPIAITRQESRFNSTALAADGGVGLMQIMPATASYIAKKTHSNNCYKNYECNIKFGTWYLSHLDNKFGNNLIYAIAGYNAGPGRAHRWQQAFTDMDSRIQIELIPFKITRDYVQKVITNKAVYDSRLEHKQAVNLLQYLNQTNRQQATYIIDDDNNNGDGSTQ